MTFYFDSTVTATPTVNRRVSTAGSPIIMFNFVRDLISRGWRVLGSGDVNSFENTGQTAGATGTGLGGGYDVITACASTVDRTSTWTSGHWSNAVTNTGGSWWRIKTPADAPVQREFVFQTPGSSTAVIDANVLIRVSLAGFTGNDATASTPPTATDRLNLVGTQSDAGGTGTGYGLLGGTAAASSIAHWAIGDLSENYAFYFVASCASVTVGNREGGLFAFDTVINPWQGSNPPATNDPDPYYYLLSSVAGNLANTAATWSTDVAIVSTPTGRLEDRAGTAMPTDTARCIASMYLGESGPPATAGHYVMGLSTPSDATSSFAGASGPLGNFAPDLIGKTAIFNVMSISRPGASVGKGIKGFASGNLIRMFSRVTGETVVFEDQTGQRWVNIGGIALRWHPTEPVAAI